jgi:hypothetical protein
MAEERRNDADELDELASHIAATQDVYESARPLVTVPQEGPLMFDFTDEKQTGNSHDPRELDVSASYPYGDAMRGNPEAVKVMVRRDIGRGESVRVEWTPGAWTVYSPGDEI